MNGTRKPRWALSRNLPQLYASTPANSALSAATLVVAMGRTGWYPGRSHYRLASVAQYTKAIGLVNEAIQDGEAWKSDQILQAVLLLGLWEVSSLALAFLLNTNVCDIRVSELSEQINPSMTRTSREQLPCSAVATRAHSVLKHPGGFFLLLKHSW